MKPHLVSSTRRAQLAHAGKWAGGCAAVGFHRAFGDRAHGRFGIMLYHRVTPHDGDAPADAVTPAHFRAQLEGLLERGFRFARLGDVIAAAGRGEPPPPRTVVVTFDDGYANTHEHAWPVLADLDVPATAFVVTAHVGSHEPFPFDHWGRNRRSTAAETMWRPLDWEACKELEASEVFEIGSHTHTHADFRGRPDEFERDVRTSLAVLTERLGPRPRPFAFPFGTMRAGFAGPDLAQAAKRAGVTCALTTEIELADPAADPFTWGRVEAVESDSAETCTAKLTGWYTWMGTMRGVFQRVASS